MVSVVAYPDINLRGLLYILNREDKGRCFQSGYCCTQGVCHYGVWEELKHQCKHLDEPDEVGRRICLIHEQILEAEEMHGESYPMFGSGCSSTLCNPARENVINNLLKRKSTMVTTNEIKKGTVIKSVQLGTPCTGIMADNMKGDRRLVNVKGSEVGMFDEIGSVYSHDITMALIDDEWIQVEHTKKQLKLKEQIDSGDWF